MSKRRNEVPPPPEGSYSFCGFTVRRGAANGPVVRKAEPSSSDPSQWRSEK